MQFVCPVLLLVFVLAKVFGIDPVVGWSWWAVTSPAWVPLGIAVICGAAGLVIKAFGAPEKAHKRHVRASMVRMGRR